MENDIDIQLYTKYLEGEKSAFELLYNKYKNKIQYFIYNIVKDYQKAEDITQDVFIYVMQNKVREGYTFKYYIYLVAKSRAYNYIKLKNRKLEINEQYFSKEDKQIENDIIDIITENEKRKEIIESINLLDEKYKNAIYLVNIEELSYKETAEILGESVQNIKNLIHRGKKELRKILLRKGLVEMNKSMKVFLITLLVGTILSGVVYAVCEVPINGKPIIEWLGIKFSENYEEYRVDVQNQEISSNETSISLTGTVCDEGFTILEFDVKLSDTDKEKLKIGKPILTEEYINTPPEELSLTKEEKDLIIEEYSNKLIDSIYISFNNKPLTNEPGIYLDNRNNYSIIIDGENYWIRPRSAQTTTKISDNEYKVYQLYFLTQEELGNKQEFNITLNNPIIMANDTQSYSNEVYIPIDGEFNVSVSKEKSIQNTNIYIPTCEEIKYKNITSHIDKVINTPLQTIVKVSYTYNNVNLNTLTNENDSNYIDTIEYKAFDENDNELGIFAYETERKITYENGKSEEWDIGDVGTSENFNNAKLERTEYIIIEKRSENSKIKIELNEKLNKNIFGKFEINIENK